MTFPLSDGTSHNWSRPSNGPELTSSVGKQGLNEPCMDPARKDCSPLTLPQMHSTCQTGSERIGFVLQQCISLAAWLNPAKIIAKKNKSRSLGGHGEVGVPGKTRAGGGWPGPAVTLKSKIFFQRDCAAVKEVRCGSLAKNISTCLKRSTVGLKLRSRAQ